MQPVLRRLRRGRTPVHRPDGRRGEDRPCRLRGGTGQPERRGGTAGAEAATEGARGGLRGLRPVQPGMPGGGLHHDGRGGHGAAADDVERAGNGR